jgi:cytochrome c oxidase subunit 2
MFRRSALIPTALSLALSAFLCGCAPDGRHLFEREGCLECHRFRGEGGYLGPDLTAVAARGSARWMKDQVRNPQRNDPASRMPAYDNLSSREIRAIVRYLQSDE